MNLTHVRPALPTMEDPPTTKTITTTKMVMVGMTKVRWYPIRVTKMVTQKEHSRTTILWPNLASVLMVEEEVVDDFYACGFTLTC